MKKRQPKPIAIPPGKTLTGNRQNHPGYHPEWVYLDPSGKSGKWYRWNG